MSSRRGKGGGPGSRGVKIPALSLWRCCRSPTPKPPPCEDDEEASEGDDAMKCLRRHDHRRDSPKVIPAENLPPGHPSQEVSSNVIPAGEGRGAGISWRQDTGLESLALLQILDPQTPALRE